jgi:hypothetical protein
VPIERRASCPPFSLALFFMHSIEHRRKSVTRFLQPSLEGLGNFKLQPLITLLFRHSSVYFFHYYSYYYYGDDSVSSSLFCCIGLLVFYLRCYSRHSLPVSELFFFILLLVR